MNDIALNISTNALRKLESFINDINFPAVISITWSEGGWESGEATGPEWVVGAHDESKVLASEFHIQFIQGLPFVFDQGDISEKLNGCTLDWAGGNFHIQHA